MFDKFDISLKTEFFLRPACGHHQSELSLGINSTLVKEEGKVLGYRAHYSVYLLATGNLITTFVSEKSGQLSAMRSAEAKFQYWLNNTEGLFQRLG